MAGLNAAFLGPVYGGYLQGQQQQQQLQAAQLENQMRQFQLQQAQQENSLNLSGILGTAANDPTLATYAALSGVATPGATPQPQGVAPSGASPSVSPGGASGPLGLQPPTAAPPQPNPPMSMPPPQAGPMPQPQGAGPIPQIGGSIPQIGGQMSLGQLMANLKRQNPGVPDMLLLNTAAKVSQILNPYDKQLLQFMLQQAGRNTITPYQQAELGLRGDQIAATEAYRKAMLQFAGNKDVQMMPGMGIDPKTNQQVPGAYIFDKSTRGLQFLPTGGPMGAGAVSKATGAAAFTPEMGALMAAMAEKGVSLPTGFRSKEQQAQMYQGLLDRNKGKSPDEIADMVKNGQIDLKALTKETQTAATQAGKVQVAANELNEFMPLVRQASAAVPRGKFMPINRLLQSADNQLSDPNLRALKIRINSLLNAYDQLASRGGTDVEKRKEARGLLTSADSPEVLETALQSFALEADAAKRAAVLATKVPANADLSGAGGGTDSGGWKIERVE